MKRTLLMLGLLASATAAAQVKVQLNVPAPPVPTITFAAPPPLVTVQPGVQVVEDHDDEIFFVDSWYWCRRGDRWYRTRDHRGGWVYVDGPGVPGNLVRVPPGHYRKYKHRGPPHGGPGKAVIVNPPGPHNAVKVKVKVKKGHH